MSIKLKDTILENINSADKLTSSAGDTTQPIYFLNGKPTNCSYTLSKSVPSDAKFTDTNTTYSQATSTTLGLVKIGYSTSNKNYAVQLNSSGQMYVNVPWTDTDTNTDTKNTAGSTDSSSKLFLIGATSQAANPQTYSHDTAYVGTDGCLYSNSTKVSVEGHTHSYASSTHTHSLGNKPASDLSSTYSSGISIGGIYNNGYPFTYGTTITASGNGGYVQLAGEWSGNITSSSNNNYKTEMYLRHRRDSYDIWSTWTRIITDRNYTEFAATKGHNHDSTYSVIGHTHSQYYDSGISRTANTVLAAPNGSAGSASFRSLVAADIPNISAAKITSGTLDVARGGTGKTTLADACNAFINSLSTGASTPVDADYYVAQYAGGGTTTTTYHRRPVSALYNYMKGKFDSVYAPTHSHPYAASDHGHSNYFISARGTYSAYTSVPGNASGAYMISTAGWYGSMTVFYAAGSNSALGFYRPGGSNSCPQICVALDSNSNWSNLGTILTSGNWSSYISIPSGGGSSFNGVWEGTLMVNGSNSRGSYPSVRWHIPNVNWAQFIMNGSGELELRGGGSQDAGYATLRTGWCCCTGLQINGESITFTT